MGLLLAVSYSRRFAARFVLALLVGIIVPFLLQEPEYVLRQYVSWIEHLKADNRETFPPEAAPRDLRLLLRVWFGLPSSTVYVALQLLGALGIALFCLTAAWKGWPQRRLLTSLLTLACCWMTLLGPATESSTYIVLAPVLAWSLLDAWLRPEPAWIRFGFLSSYILFLAASAASWFPGVRCIHALGLHPLGALLLLVFFLVKEIRYFSENNARPQQTNRPSSSKA